MEDWLDIVQYSRCKSRGLNRVMAVEKERVGEAVVTQTIRPQQLTEQEEWRQRLLQGKSALSTHSFNAQWLSIWHESGTVSGSEI